VHQSRLAVGREGRAKQRGKTRGTVRERKGRDEQRLRLPALACSGRHAAQASALLAFAPTRSRVERENQVPDMGRRCYESHERTGCCGSCCPGDRRDSFGCQSLLKCFFLSFSFFFSFLFFSFFFLSIFLSFFFFSFHFLSFFYFLLFIFYVFFFYITL
jgi:hypothetical protein